MRKAYQEWRRMRALSSRTKIFKHSAYGLLNRHFLVFKSRRGFPRDKAWSVSYFTALVQKVKCHGCTGICTTEALGAKVSYVWRRNRRRRSSVYSAVDSCCPWTTTAWRMTMTTTLRVTEVFVRHWDAKRVRTACYPTSLFCALTIRQGDERQWKR